MRRCADLQPPVGIYMCACSRTIWSLHSVQSAPVQRVCLLLVGCQILPSTPRPTVGAMSQPHPCCSMLTDSAAEATTQLGLLVSYWLPHVSPAHLAS